MRIIKQGVLPKDQEWLGVCDHCGTEAVEKESALVKQPVLLMGEYILVERCPFCKETMAFLKKYEE